MASGGFGSQNFGPYYPKLPSKPENTPTEDYDLQTKWVKAIIFSSKEFQAIIKRLEMLEQEIAKFRDGGLEGTERHRIKETVISALINLGNDKTVAKKVFEKVILEIGYKSGEQEILKACIKEATPH